MFDFTVIGAPVIDVLVRWPDMTENSISTPSEYIGISTGGDALNEATVLSSLGKKVNLVAKIGNDWAGELILSYCREYGISTDDFVVADGLDTAVNIVMVDAKGERRFITNKNGSLRRQTLSDIPVQKLGNSKIFSFASIFVSPAFDAAAMAKLFSSAKKAGCIICADMTMCKKGETVHDLKEALRFVDYLFPNYEEAQKVARKDNISDIADAFLEAGVGHVIIKTGKSGCFAKTPSESFEVPAYANAKCIDTTGAGDNFAAGFLYALSEGMSLRECMKFANAVASIAIESMGATTGVKSAAQVFERFKCL